MDGKLSAPLTAWLQRFLIEQLLTYAGIAVSVAWIMQAISGRRKPWPDWIDRLGRFLGVLWIAAGLLWATRPYLALL